MLVLLVAVVNRVVGVGAVVGVVVYAVVMVGCCVDVGAGGADIGVVYNVAVCGVVVVVVAVVVVLCCVVVIGVVVCVYAHVGVTSVNTINGLFWFYIVVSTNICCDHG